MIVKNSNSISADVIEDTIVADYLERHLFILFSINLAVALEFLTLQEIVGNYKNQFALSAKQTRTSRQKFPFYLYLKLVIINLYFPTMQVYTI